jgi:hypothetical protein
MADPAPARRHFQFRLRTLMIVVTLFCAVFGGYVIRERAVVQERAAAFAEMQQKVFSPFPGQRFWVDTSKVSWLRRWLGDQAVTNAYIPGDADISTVQRFHAAFPETLLEAAWVGGDEPSENEDRLGKICDDSWKTSGAIDYVGR